MVTAIKSTKAAAVLLVFLACSGTALELSRIRVDGKTGHFLDEHGRVRLFRGVNSVLKRPPWYEVSMYWVDAFALSNFAIEFQILTWKIKF